MLTPIQTTTPYKLIEIDFIDFFQRYRYRNTYSYNVVDNFTGHMYSYPITKVSINNVILLFNNYFKANLKPYTIYIDANSHFTSLKLYTYFQIKDIRIVFALSLSHKSVNIIETSNNILQQALKKMQELGKK